MFVENFPEIIAIFQEQDLPDRLGLVVRRKVDFESDDLLGFRSSQAQSHNTSR
jgi:hypothetical protein